MKLQSVCATSDADTLKVAFGLKHLLPGIVASRGADTVLLEFAVEAVQRLHKQGVPLPLVATSRRADTHEPIFAPPWSLRKAS